MTKQGVFGRFNPAALRAATPYIFTCLSVCLFVCSRESAGQTPPDQKGWFRDATGWLTHICGHGYGHGNEHHALPVLTIFLDKSLLIGT